MKNTRNVGVGRMSRGGQTVTLVANGGGMFAIAAGHAAPAGQFEPKIGSEVRWAQSATPSIIAETIPHPRYPANPHVGMSIPIGSDLRLIRFARKAPNAVRRHQLMSPEQLGAFHDALNMAWVCHLAKCRINEGKPRPKLSLYTARFRASNGALCSTLGKDSQALEFVSIVGGDSGCPVFAPGTSRLWALCTSGSGASIGATRVDNADTLAWIEAVTQ